MVSDVVAQTVICLEHPRQMDIAPGAFWKAPYLCHIPTLFQVMLQLLY